MDSGKFLVSLSYLRNFTNAHNKTNKSNIAIYPWLISGLKLSTPNTGLQGLALGYPIQSSWLVTLEQEPVMQEGIKSVLKTSKE